MTTNNRKMLNESVETLKKLHFKPENIMVTGSIALDMLGLLDRDAHDVDFNIRMDEQTWHCLKLIEAINDDGQHEENYLMNRDMIVITSKGIKLNIWKAKPNDWSEMKDNKTGIYISQADKIIEAKNSYKRNKDLIDINDIIKKIL